MAIEYSSKINYDNNVAKIGLILRSVLRHSVFANTITINDFCTKKDYRMKIISNDLPVLLNVFHRCGLIFSLFMASLELI